MTRSGNHRGPGTRRQRRDINKMQRKKHKQAGNGASETEVQGCVPDSRGGRWACATAGGWEPGRPLLPVWPWPVRGLLASAPSLRNGANALPSERGESHAGCTRTSQSLKNCPHAPSLDRVLAAPPPQASPVSFPPQPLPAPLPEGGKPISLGTAVLPQ